jgi:dihydroneopterin aldolase
MDSSDEIVIQDLELMAQVGVPDEERAQPQRLTVSLVLQPRNSFDRLNDELKGTVDYVAVSQNLQQFLSGRRRQLIETLAHEMAEHLLAQFDLTRVELELRKFVLPETRFVAARIVRTRAFSGE